MVQPTGKYSDDEVGQGNDNHTADTDQEPDRAHTSRQRASTGGPKHLLWVTSRNLLFYFLDGGRVRGEYRVPPGARDGAAR